MAGQSQGVNINADHVEVLSQTLKALLDDLIAQGILAAAP